MSAMSTSATNTRSNRPRRSQRGRGAGGAVTRGPDAGAPAQGARDRSSCLQGRAARRRISCPAAAYLRGHTQVGGGPRAARGGPRAQAPPADPPGTRAAGRQVGSAGRRRLAARVRNFLLSNPLNRKDAAMRLRRMAPPAPWPPLSPPPCSRPRPRCSRAPRADRMQPLPALTAQRAGGPLRGRLGRDRAGRKHRHNDPATRLSPGALDAMRGQHFLSFNPRGQGEAIEVVGDLATGDAGGRSWCPAPTRPWPRSISRGTASPGGGAAALAAQARRLDPGARLAVIAWLGYPTPATLSPAVMTSGDAGQGASALRPLVTGLARHGDQVALLCHSYGSVVCGLAAPHLPVTDIAVFGSPGMDAASVRQLDTSARVWAGRASGDWIRYVPHVQLLGLGFGAGPHGPGLRRPPVRLRRQRPQRLPPPGQHVPAQPGLHRARRPRRSHPMTRHAGHRGPRAWPARIDAATPPHRDRAVDALRALAIAGVILGHWLVTALVLSSSRTGQHGARRQPAGLAARPHPAVVDLPDARRLLPGRRLRRRAQLHRGLPGLAAQAPGPAVPPGGGARRRVGAARDRR